MSVAVELQDALADFPEVQLDSAAVASWARVLLPILNRLPAIGHSDGFDRLDALLELSKRSLPLARIVEGHLDAAQILQEAGREIDATALYAIWASGGPKATTAIAAESAGASLGGYKPFCSGADLVDRTLLYVDDSHQLVDLAIGVLGADSIEFDRSGWKAEGLSSTHTWNLQFQSVSAEFFTPVGQPDWYFKRPGFWLGALGPAACWAGGAIRLVDYAANQTLKDDIAHMHLGAMVSAQHGMTSALYWGAMEAARDPQNTRQQAYTRALSVRHLIERHCVGIVDHFSRAFGPRPLVFDKGLGVHIQELQIYIRQCHADSDLVALGREKIARNSPCLHLQEQTVRTQDSR